jgi:uncharacterized protein (UPF0297 family)
LREANQVTDLLAKHDLYLVVNLKIFNVVSNFVSVLLSADFAYISFPKDF